MASSSRSGTRELGRCGLKPKLPNGGQTWVFVYRTEKCFSLVVMPSLWEAASLLATEILVAGVRLVASMCRVLEEIIEGTPATSVSPRDVRGLAEASAQRIAASNKREARACAGGAQVRFDVRRTAGEVDELFSHLIAKGLRTGREK